MKKFLNSLKFIFKASLLIILLLVGWAFINVTSLVKGKKTAKDSSNSIFGINDANADVPSDCSGCSGCSSACPQVAYFNGRDFRIENDFLYGSPMYYATDHAMAPDFKRTPVRPDMVKFRRLPQKKDSVLTLQLQENEAEESFIDWLKLIRVVHPKGSEVVIDSSFDSFHVFDKKAVENNLRLPSEVMQNGVNIAPSVRKLEWLWADPKKGEDPIVQKNDHLEFVFHDLKRGVAPALVVKSTFRDWMMGEENVAEAKRTLASYMPTSILKVVPTALIVLAYFVLERKSASGLLAFAPAFMGVGTQCKSIVFSYKDEAGDFQVATINKPRAWAYGTEYVRLPAEAIQKDGSLHLKADFTKRHKLAFVGVLQDEKELGYRAEELPIVRSQSSRLGDVISKLSESSREYAHMIPGDTIDVSFADNKLKVEESESETYLMQSMGFYTPLGKQSKKLAGNWQEKISPEAKEFFASLTTLKKYS